MDGQHFVQAWPKGGVQWMNGWGEGHESGTVVDLYAYKPGYIVTPVHLLEAGEWLEKQIGKKYDWRGVFRFLTRAPGHDDNDAFCSELDQGYAIRLSLPVINKPSWKTMPCDFSESEILEKVGSIIC